MTHTNRRTLSTGLDTILGTMLRTAALACMLFGVARAALVVSAL